MRRRGVSQTFWMVIAIVLALLVLFLGVYFYTKGLLYGGHLVKTANQTTEQLEKEISEVTTTES